MKSFVYYADMGSLRIKLEGGAMFLNNGIGDGEYKVIIREDTEDTVSPREFNTYSGMFAVFTKAEVMEHDCVGSLPDTVLCELKPGLYYAQHNDDGDIWIVRFND